MDVDRPKVLRKMFRSSDVLPDHAGVHGRSALVNYFNQFGVIISGRIRLQTEEEYRAKLPEPQPVLCNYRGMGTRAAKHGNCFPFAGWAGILPRQLQPVSFGADQREPPRRATVPHKPLMPLKRCSRRLCFVRDGVRLHGHVVSGSRKRRKVFPRL